MATAQERSFPTYDSIERETGYVTPNYDRSIRLDSVFPSSGCSIFVRRSLRFAVQQKLKEWIRQIYGMGKHRCITAFKSPFMNRTSGAERNSVSAKAQCEAILWSSECIEFRYHNTTVFEAPFSSSWRNNNSYGIGVSTCFLSISIGYISEVSLLVFAINFMV